MIELNERWTVYDTISRATETAVKDEVARELRKEVDRTICWTINDAVCNEVFTP